MDAFNRREGELHVEGVAVEAIVSEVGTPCFVYSLAALRDRYSRYVEGFGSQRHLVCYSVKANSNLAVLRALANEGSGFDVVSGGELTRVLAAGGDAGKVVFSGVGKQEWEIRAALDAGILLFNVESSAELDLIDRVARENGVRAPVALRVNPDVDARTHPYISTGLKSSKFGLPIEGCLEHYGRAHDMEGLKVMGVDCHIGSQLTSAEPVAEAARRMAGLVDRLGEAGITVEYLDMGGGLGVVYDDETPPQPEAYAGALVEALGERALTLIVEPGRSIAANAGALVTRVLFHKVNGDKRFIVVDAAMNDLARPSLYSAYHTIEAVSPCQETTIADVVGPVCESGDFFAREREVPEVAPGGLLSIMSAGAYGYVMASNYNSRPRPAEVLVDGERWDVVGKRETLESLFAGESIPPALLES
ncbi:MAG: diaminopimelate decarboxylase [Candidatus Binatia bacterium]